MLKKIMKKLNFLLLSIIVLTSSCKKDNIIVNVNQSGTLNVQIIDSIGKVYPNVKVHLVANNAYYSSNSYMISEIDALKTDSKGNANFGGLIQGTYVVYTDTIKTDKKSFISSKTFQITSGDPKNLVINPFDYIGKAKFKITMYNPNYSFIRLDTLKVGIIRFSDYNQNPYAYPYNIYPYIYDQKWVQYVLDKAYEIKNCDLTGIVEFGKVPSNINYIVFVFYKDDSNKILGFNQYSQFSFAKDDTYTNYISYQFYGNN